MSGFCHQSISITLKKIELWKCKHPVNILDNPYYPVSYSKGVLTSFSGPHRQLLQSELMILKICKRSMHALFWYNGTFCRLHLLMLVWKTVNLCWFSLVFWKTEVFQFIVLHQLVSCFTYRYRFQNGANNLFKLVYMVNSFLLKSFKSCVVWIIWFCSNFTRSWYKYLSRNYKWYFRLSMLATTMVT